MLYPSVAMKVFRLQELATQGLLKLKSDIGMTLKVIGVFLGVMNFIT
jgi:hypothetical protein